jgi:uncharacterized OB-fold protein
MKLITKWPAEIPIQSQHTAGVAGQIFFSALKERGELVGTRCPACAQVYVPARLFCERCFAELSEQVFCGPDGILRSFTLSYVNRDDGALESPLAFGLVVLDGATTCILHRLLDVNDPTQVSIGDRVRLVLKPEADRAGSILDIEGFRVTARRAR